MIDLKGLRKQLHSTKHNNPNPEIIENLLFDIFCHHLSDTISSCIFTLERLDYTREEIVSKLDNAILRGTYLPRESTNFEEIFEHNDPEFIKNTYHYNDEESQLCAEHAPELLKTMWSQAKDILEGERIRKETLSKRSSERSPAQQTPNIKSKPSRSVTFSGESSVSQLVAGSTKVPPIK